MTDRVEALLGGGEVGALAEPRPGQAVDLGDAGVDQGDADTRSRQAVPVQALRTDRLRDLAEGVTLLRRGRGGVGRCDLDVGDAHLRGEKVAGAAESPDQHPCGKDSREAALLPRQSVPARRRNRFRHPVPPILGDPGSGATGDRYLTMGS